MSNTITIVSGLPRSGTSMMMKMLETGGIPALIDDVRTADEDNPKGYYEFERVKQLPDDTAWLPDAQGKAVKMVSMLLYDLPKDREYNVVFMRRKMPEILASQKKMLLRNNKDMIVDDAEMKELFEKHLEQILHYLDTAKHFKVCYVWYHDMLIEPQKTIDHLNAFFNHTLNTAAMQGVVDQTLYRNRS